MIFSCSSSFWLFPWGLFNMVNQEFKIKVKNPVSLVHISLKNDISKLPSNNQLLTIHLYKACRIRFGRFLLFGLLLNHYLEAIICFKLGCWDPFWLEHNETTESRHQNLMEYFQIQLLLGQNCFKVLRVLSSIHLHNHL